MYRFFYPLAFIGCMLPQISHAQNDARSSNISVSGTNPQTSNPLAPVQVNEPYITTTGVGKGPTLTQNSQAATYQAGGWTTAGAMNPENYIYWTMNPVNAPLNQGNIQFSIFRNEAGPQQYILRSSLDNYTTDIGGGAISGTAGEQNFTLNYPSTDINPTAPVTFRLYAYGAKADFGNVEVGNIRFMGGALQPVAAGIYDFDLEGNEKDVVLQWRTGSETGLSRYEIERSSDGMNFEVVGTQPVQNRPINQYRFHDLNPFKRKNFYRLVTVQLGGNRVLSRTLVLNGTGTTGAEAPLQVLPNPVTGSVFSVQHPVATIRALIRITDFAGQEIYRNAVPAGSMISRIQNLTLQNGSYYLTFEDGENRLSTVLVK